MIRRSRDGICNHITSADIDEISISARHVETLAKSEIHTSEDFLSTNRSDILTLKGLGEKTVDKITTLLLDATSEANSKNVDNKNVLEEIEKV